MVYILLAVLASTAIIVTFRLFERFSIRIVPAITVNYIVASGFGYINETGTFSFADLPARPWFPVSILFGIGLVGGFFMFGLTARKSGVVMTAIASRMSVVIPVMIGLLIFHDTAGAFKILGIVSALLAFYLTFHRGKDPLVTARDRLIFPLLLFIMMGFNDSLMKFAQYYYIQGEFVLFLSTSFLFSLVTGGAVFAADMIRNRKWPSVAEWAGGTFLGLINWYSTLCFLKALDLFDVSTVVPVIHVSVVGLSALTGFFVFREKLRPVNWVGILLALLAILLIANG